jgi:hypothetical protein
MDAYGEAKALQGSGSNPIERISRFRSSGTITPIIPDIGWFRDSFITPSPNHGE